MEDLQDWATGRLLSTAARLVEHAWNERLAEHGLTHAGVIALHVLGAGPLTQAELAARCQVQDQTMGRTLERLEREGFVVRRRDRTDRRRILVSRTDEGADRVALAVRLEREVTPATSDPQRLRELLVEVVETMQAQRWPAAP